jgi:hypothetical protein
MLRMEAGQGLRARLPLPLLDGLLWYAGFALMLLSPFVG